MNAGAQCGHKHIALGEGQVAMPTFLAHVDLDTY